MLKQLDMTETAKVVFNELNGKPATVGGDCTKHIPFTRTLSVNTDPAGYGGAGRLPVRLLQTPSAMKGF